MKLTEAKLLENPELERAIAEDPYDEQRWIVLEDWLMEQGDPRGALVPLEKAGQKDAAARMLRRLYPKLFGDKHQALAQLLYKANWRAGYLREVHFGTIHPLPFATLCQAPAASLLRGLLLSIPCGRIPWAFEELSRAVFASTLHELTVSNPHVDAPLVKPDWLSPLPRLRRLGLRSAYLDPPSEVPRISELVLAPTRYDVQHFEPMLQGSKFPAVTDLLVDLSYFAEPSIPRTTWMTMFDGRFAPSLERFVMRSASFGLACEILDVIAKSPLLSRLVAVNLGENDEHMLVRTHYGDIFDHVTVTLPADH